MATALGQMTERELKELIESIIDQKLLDFFGDPDESLPIRKAVHDRLLRQRKKVTQGERGRPLGEIVQELGLDKVDA